MNLIIILALVILPEPLEKAEKAIEQLEFEKSKEILTNYLDENPRDPEALSLMSFTYSELGSSVSDKEEKEKIFQKCYDLAKKAYEIDQNSVRANFALAVAYGRQLDFVGLDEQLKYIQKIRPKIKFVLNRKKDNAYAWYILGQWHYQLADLNLMEETAARAIFGDDLDNASMDKAVEYFSKAKQLDPDRIIFNFYLGKAYLKNNKESKAEKVLTYTADLEPQVKNDHKTKEKARDLLSEL